MSYLVGILAPKKRLTHYRTIVRIGLISSGAIPFCRHAALSNWLKVCNPRFCKDKLLQHGSKCHRQKCGEEPDSAVQSTASKWTRREPRKPQKPRDDICENNPLIKTTPRERKISPKFFRPKFFHGRPRGMSVPKCLF